MAYLARTKSLALAAATTTVLLSLALQETQASWSQRAAPDGVARNAPEGVDAPEETSRHITLVLAGDTGYAPHRAAPRPNTVTKHGRTLSFANTTRLIEPEINGDINFANMETVISARTDLTPRSKAFNFVTHPNGARHLVRVGFNLFSMANNHSFDFGAKGVRESVRHADALLDQGLMAHAGVGTDRSGASRTPVFKIKDIRMAFGAIGIGASSGGIQRATRARPGQLNLRDKRDVGLLTSNLRNAPADYRILSVHQGPERVIRPSAYEVATIQKTMLKQGDIDLYIGHHAHVARGVELSGNRLVIYGLGNFLHHGTASMLGKGGCQDYSLLMRVHLVSKKPGEKPELAALQALPITSTHMQTARMQARKAAKRIAILNGLAAQFDQESTNRRGIRFDIQPDGSGLYCLPSAKHHASTRSLCAAHRPYSAAMRTSYSRALATCGRSYKPARPEPMLMVKKQAPKGNRRKADSSKLASLKTSPLRGSKAAVKAKRANLRSSKRPDFSKMTKAQAKAYWTKVWYEKQARKRARRLARRGG